MCQETNTVPKRTSLEGSRPIYMSTHRWLWLAKLTLNKIHSDWKRRDEFVDVAVRLKRLISAHVFAFMFDTILPADSVEFCPHPNAQDVFVCGTYNLMKSDEVVRTTPQKRNGQCLVFKCHYDQNDIAQSSLCVQSLALSHRCWLTPIRQQQNSGNKLSRTARHEMVTLIFSTTSESLCQVMKVS